MHRRNEGADGPLPATTAATASTMDGGRASLADLARRLAPSFARAESRQRALASLHGLLSAAERQTSGQVAEICGEPTPSGCQYVLSRADGDADAVRDELRTAGIHPLGAPHGVLVLDETGFVKTGGPSAGVARQYTGTVGTVENGQIGGLLGYAGPLGHALIDRELSVPQAWAHDRERCRQAGIPVDRPFATKPPPARQLLARACAAGVPATWVTGDSVSGHDRRRRVWLAARPPADVLAVSGQDYVWRGWQQRQVNSLLASRPAEGWTRLSAGDGAQGPRGHAWRGLPPAAPVESGWCRWRLVRRRVSDPADMTASVVFAPQATTLEEVVRVAGSRWTIESGVETAKGDGGLDHDAVRSWTGWSRHITLAMWALALLTSLRAGTLAVEAVKNSLRPPQEASPLAAFKARRGLLAR